MKKSVRYLGLDVHAETIAVAVADVGEEPRFVGIVPNHPEAVGRLIRKIAGAGELRACYEAGPCGYGLYWQLTALGVSCAVVAPTLIPVRSGDRVKTDRRDALKLARGLRSGDLTAVWVPDAAHEALRDLMRARLAAKRDQLRHRHRLSKFLLRQGRRPPGGTKAWTLKYLEWVRRDVRFDHGAQAAVLLDYLGEIERVAERIVRLERAIDEAIAAAPEAMRDVIAALQALRGIAKRSPTSSRTIWSRALGMSGAFSFVGLMCVLALASFAHADTLDDFYAQSLRQLQAAPAVDDRLDLFENPDLAEALRPRGGLLNPYVLSNPNTGRIYGTVHSLQFPNMFAPAGSVTNPWVFDPVPLERDTSPVGVRAWSEAP